MTLASPLDMLFYRERTTPWQVAFHQPAGREWREYAWEEVGQEVRTMATYLKSRGFPPGSRIAIFGQNSAHWIMADWAIWLAGFISVPLYPNLRADSVEEILVHSGAKLLFLGAVTNWEEARYGIPPELELIALPEAKQPKIPRWQEVKKFSLPMTSARIPNLDDTATIVYTSGTMGSPKGVVHSFRSIAFAGSNVAKTCGASPRDRIISYLPLAHVAERLLCETVLLYSGCSVYFVDRVERFRACLRYARPTIFFGVPRIWEKIFERVTGRLNAAWLAKYARFPLFGPLLRYLVRYSLCLHRTRILVTGSAPTPQKLHDWFRALGMPLQEAYGLTENFAYSHFNQNPKLSVASPGTPFPGVEVKFSPEQEILVRSPATMSGYYRSEDLTDAALDREEWLHTGDLGEIAEDGTLRITGRKKAIFKTSKGKYVAPWRIEEALIESDYFEQVCVMGQGQPQPIAVVRLQKHYRATSALALRRDLEKLKDSVNADLDLHEQIDQIAVIDEEWTVENGALTPTMKVRREVLENRFERALSTWKDSDEDVVFVTKTAAQS